MIHFRSYIQTDWPAILEICLLAFTPIHKSFEGMLGTELFKLVYPDWKASNEKYLRSLIDSEERDRIFVADENGIVLGFIRFELNIDKQCGEIGLNAVHPDRQSSGIGSLMYSHVLDLLRNRGMTYVKVSIGGDQSHI